MSLHLQLWMLFKLFGYTPLAWRLPRKSLFFIQSALQVLCFSLVRKKVTKRLRDQDKTGWGCPSFVTDGDVSRKTLLFSVIFGWVFQEQKSGMIRVLSVIGWVRSRYFRILLLR